MSPNSLPNSTQYKLKWASNMRTADPFARWLVRIGGSFLLLCLLSTVGFIIYKSVYFFDHYGFAHFFGRNWHEKTKKFGIGDLIINTCFVLLVSMAIAVPLMIFTAIFVNEFMTSFWKKRVKSLIRVLAGIPSVVFGLFGLSVLGLIFKELHPGGKEGVAQTSFILTCVIIAFMGLPIMLALTIDALEAIPNRVRASAASLGVAKTTYSLLLIRLVWLRVVGAVLLGMARIIGETMAVLMIAGNDPNGLHLHSGITKFLYSQIATLASLIGFEVLEATDQLHNSALFAVGLLLFVVVLIINLLVLLVSKLNHRWKKMRRFAIRASHSEVNSEKLVAAQKSIRHQINQQRWSTRINQGLVVFFLVSSSVIVLSFIGLITMSILVRGFLLMNPADFTTSNPKIGIQASFLVSLMLVLFTIVIATPIALVIAVLLTEYMRRDGWLANLISYFLNVLASTPSIIYGLFGLYLFIFLFHMPLSIVTGALTLIFLLLPMLIRNFQEAFWSVPNRLRASSQALGVSKIKTINRIVIAESLPAIATAVLLAAGRAIGESAPIYLTLGTTVVFPHAGLLSPGAAMSTQILALWRVGGIKSAVRVMYELAFLIMLLVWFFNAFGSFLALNLSPHPQVSPWKKIESFCLRSRQYLLARNKDKIEVKLK